MAIDKQVLWIVFIVGGMLLTGTINTIVKKVQNGWMAPGIIGRNHKVRKVCSHPYWPPFARLLTPSASYSMSTVQRSMATVLLDVFG
jgi:hypothetical protein